MPDQVKREAQVTAELQELISRVDQLENNISELSNRMAPVLSPDYPEPPSQIINPGNSPAAKAPIAEQLANVVQRVKQINTQVAKLTGRIEV